MFSNPEVIELSRKFVCVRIDSYESAENQEIVRSYLDGRFENTAFCVLAPDGETRLTRSGRGPKHVFRTTDALLAELQSILAKTKAQGDRQAAPLPDFHSFKLALNIASADQRVLVLIAAPEAQLGATEKGLRSLAWNPKVEGRFHFDLASDGSWKEPLGQEAEAKPGIYVISPGAFGLDGKVLNHLELDSEPETILEALARANATYAATTTKKLYSDHVAKGRAQGIRIEMAVPFGEDRDGDGEIDHRPGPERESRR